MDLPISIGGGRTGLKSCHERDLFCGFDAIKQPIAWANRKREGEVDAKGGKYAKTVRQGTPQLIYTLERVN